MLRKVTLQHILANLPVFLILGLLVFSIIVFYPGFFSPDSSSSYEQFQNLSYTDWQPVIFILPWVLFHVKGAIFLLNILLVYLGIAIIFQRNVKCGNWLYNYPLLFFIFNPVVFITICHVWKDITMIGCLIFAIALISIYKYIAKHYLKICIQVLYFILLSYAMLVRGNGVFAALSLYIYGFYYFYLSCFNVKSKIKVILSTLISLVFISIVMTANNYITYSVLNTQKTYPQSYMMLNDMAHIECITNHNFKIPDALFLIKDYPVRNTMCEIAKEFGTGNGFYWSMTPVFSVVPNDIQYNSIKNSWVFAISHFPMDYIYYRFIAFYQDLIHTQWGVAYYLGNYQRIFNGLNIFASDYDLIVRYEAYLSILLGFCILCFNIVANKKILWATIASGFIYLGGWIPLIPAADARYFLYSYLVGLLSLCLIERKEKPGSI